MMSGKIVGVGAAGLVQIAIWFVLGAIATRLQDAASSHLFGASAGRQAGADAVADARRSSSSCMLCFVFGYLFYSAMYAAVGAMVSSRAGLAAGADAGHVPARDRHGRDHGGHERSARPASRSVMTMVPFWSPMLMPLRYFLGGATLGAGRALARRSSRCRPCRVARRREDLPGRHPDVWKAPQPRELVRWIRY